MSLSGVMFLGMATALLAVLFKQGKSEYGIYLTIAASLFIFLLILSGMKSVVDTIRQIEEYIHFGDAYINILIKIVGISYLTQFATDICRDCGYQSLASQLQIFGKVSVLAVSMPVVMTLLEVIHQILG